jgi:uncharacterized protein YbjQ (UPF0145 family)
MVIVTGFPSEFRASVLSQSDDAVSHLFQNATPPILQQAFNGGHNMLVTTTNTVEGKRITAYKGLVAGEAILGANLFRDLFASIRDIVGGRSGSYEKVLNDARQTAIAELTDKAARLGANAVIGVDIDYETVGQNGSMLMVTAAGTAVVIE